MKTFKEIIKPYKKRLKEIDYKNINNEFSPTIYLFQKWASYVEYGYYGFDLEGIPFVWAQIIDDFLKEIDENVPNLKIQQIKLKWGIVNVHIKTNIDSTLKYDQIKVEKLIKDLQNTLKHKDLVY